MVSSRSDSRIEEMEQSLRALGDRVCTMDTQFTSLTSRVDNQFASLTDRVGNVDNRIALLERHMADIKNLLTLKNSEGSTSTPNPSADSHAVEISPSGGNKTNVDLGNSCRHETSFRKLELPTFNGADPVAWLARIERYFLLNDIPEEERLLAVLVCLEGPALSWYQYREQRGPFHRWSEFRAEVLQRFGSPQQRSPVDELITLRQTTTVAEFREHFEHLVASVHGASEEWLLSLFLAGLSHEIAADVRLFGPVTLDGAMQLAQKIEARNWACSHGSKTSPIIPQSYEYSVGSQSSQLMRPISKMAPVRSTYYPAYMSQSGNTNVVSSHSSSPNPRPATMSNTGEGKYLPPHSRTTNDDRNPRQNRDFRRLSHEEYQSRADRGLFSM